MGTASPRPIRPPPVMVRQRRAFGLDAQRPPDPRRIEGAVLEWLKRAIPDVVPLRVAGLEDADPDGARGQDEGIAMALLLPHGQVAVLQIEGRAERPGRRSLALLRNCLARRVPVAVIRNLDEARAALRRFGFEAREA